MIGEFVLVRTYSAGVHCGKLVKSEGKEVHLHDARRIWRWSEANTLNEVALYGAGENSRISEPVPHIIVTEGVEIILCSDKSRENLSRSRWGS